MSSITFCPHPLTLDNRRCLPVPAGVTVGEALVIAGADPAAYLAVSINGCVCVWPDCLNRIITAGDQLTARVVLHGGGGDSNPLQAVLTIGLLVGAGLLAPSLATAAGFTGKAATAATAVISGTIVGIGSVGLNALFPITPPRLPASQNNQSSSTYSLEGGRNAIRHYAPHALALGRHRIYPDFGARPYIDYDEQHNSFLNMIFNIGYGVASLEDLKIGETDLANYKEVKKLNLGGSLLEDADESSIGYEKNYMSEIGRRREPGRPTGSSSRYTARHRLQSMNASSEGVSVTNGAIAVDKDCTIVVNGIALHTLAEYAAHFHQISLTSSIEWRKTSGGAPWRQYRSTSITVDVLRERLQTDVRDIIAALNLHDGGKSEHRALNINITNYGATTAQVEICFRREEQIVIHGNVFTEPNIQITETANGWTELATEGSVYMIGIDFVGSLYQVSSTGTIQSFNIVCQLQYRQTSASEWQAMLELADTATPIPSVNGDEFTIRHGSSEPYRKGFLFAMPKIASYDVRIRQVSEPSVDAKQIRKLVMALKSYRPDNQLYDRQNRIALRIQASDQFNGVIDRFNAIAQARCASWDSVQERWIPDKATSNPADWLYAFARGRYATSGRLLWGCGLGDDEIASDALQEWHSFCDKYGLEINLILDQSLSATETLETIARAGRATITWQSGQLGVVWDAPGLPVIALFSPENILAGSFTIKYAGDHDIDEVEAIYVDRTDGWKQKSLRMAMEETATPARSRRVELLGITNPEVAGEELELAVRAAKYRNARQITWEAALEGLVIGKGDVVLLSHDLTDWGTTGRCLGTVSQTELAARYVQADRALEDEQHALVYTGGRIYMAMCQARSNRLFFQGDTQPATTTDAGDWHFVAGPQAIPGYRAKVVSATPLDSHRVRITAIPDNPEYYQTSRVRERELWPHLPTFLEELPADSIAVATRPELEAMQSGQKYHLTDDINLTDAAWMSLRLDDIELDGRHHKIIGLNSALFDRTNGLAVHNLQIVKSSNQGNRAGLLANYCTKSLMLKQVSTCPLCEIADASFVEGLQGAALLIGSVGPNLTTIAQVRNVLGRGTVQNRNAPHATFSAGLIGSTLSVTEFDTCRALYTIKVKHEWHSNPNATNSIGAVCNQDNTPHHSSSTYRNCHVGVQLVLHENSDTSVTVGVTGEKSDVSKRAGWTPIFIDCTYSPEVHNPVLRQGSISKLA